MIAATGRRLSSLFAVHAETQELDARQSLTVANPAIALAAC